MQQQNKTKAELLAMSKPDLQKYHKEQLNKDADPTLKKEDIAKAILSAFPAPENTNQGSDPNQPQQPPAPGPVVTDSPATGESLLNKDGSAPTIAPEEDKDFFFGSEDADKTKKLPKDLKGSVVVEQVEVRMLDGQTVEMESTRVTQAYTPEMYNRLNDDNKGKGKSFFAESNLRVKVLHKPS